MIFREMKLYGSSIKTFLIFYQKKAFLIFQELSYISGNKNPKKVFTFREVTSQAKKQKVSYISEKRTF